MENVGKKTLTIIKPLAVQLGHTGEILAIIEKNGFRICALKKLQLTVEMAESFYAVHKGKSFFEGLIKSMTSGPIVVAVLEKDNAVEDYRRLMGPTDPAEAAKGTIRERFGVSVQKNAVHGSDSDDNAEREISFFFASVELT